MTAYIVFFLIALFHLLSISHSPWQGISKALLMPALAIVYFCVHQGVVNVFLMSGLALGFLGDILLIREEKPLRFLSGLIFFLGGHVLYILALADQVDWTALCLGQLILPLFYIPFLIVFFISFRKGVGKMLPAMIVYAVVLALMGTAALFRWLSGGGITALWAFIGSILFLISDGVLSRGIFLKPVPASSWIVMSTYIAAQFFIVFSFI